MPQGTTPSPEQPSELALMAGLIIMVAALILAGIALMVPGLPGDVVAGASLVVFVLGSVMLLRAAWPKRVEPQPDDPESEGRPSSPTLEDPADP